MSLQQPRIHLLHEALQRFGQNLAPVVSRKSLTDCYELYDDTLTAWFNTPDHSTHLAQVHVDLRKD